MVEAINPMLPALANMVRSIKDSIIETKEFLRSIGLLSELNKVIPIVEQLEITVTELERKLESLEQAGFTFDLK